MSIEVVQMEKLYLGGKKQLSTTTYTAEMEISYNRDWLHLKEGVYREIINVFECHTHIVILLSKRKYFE